MINRPIQLVCSQVGEIYGLLAAFLFLELSAPAGDADATTSEGQRGATPADAAQRSPQVLVNHVGFTPRAAKYCLVAGRKPVAFEIVDTATGQAVFTGHTTSGGLDLGAWQVGDFSSLSKSGTFQVRVGNECSGTFAIRPDVYEDALRKTVAYFSKQRCGPSTTGYHTAITPRATWMTVDAGITVSIRMSPAAGTMPVTCASGSMLRFWA